MTTKNQKKVLVIFGTRPEAIKMAPVVLGLNKHCHFTTKVCVTGQHREMLDQVLKTFDIQPSFDLNLMTHNQSLSAVSARILEGLEKVYLEFKPDYVLVHGDTTTSFIATLSAFYFDLAVGHIEAGLRSDDIKSPWPEEANRRLTSQLAALHFAPTKKAVENLLKEGVSAEKIIQTGNTVIDALHLVQNQINTSSQLHQSLIEKFLSQGINLNGDNQVVLITGHRRENFGKRFYEIIEAIRELALSNKAVKFLYPVHFNPNVRTPVYERLNDLQNVFLIQPQDYTSFVFLMMKSSLILTDSGGIQEEAPSLGKPVLVTRDNTERPESVAAGASKLVGSSKLEIITNIQEILNSIRSGKATEKISNLYGDGKASDRIIEFLKQHSESQI